MSLNSSPPWSFGRVSVDQAIQAIFLLPLSLSHQKRVKAVWILWHRDTGSMKHDIVWDGIGKSTLFSIVIFPAVDRKRFDHPFAFWVILSTIDEKRSRFFLPNNSRITRYLPTPPSFSIMRIVFAAFFRGRWSSAREGYGWFWDINGLTKCWFIALKDSAESFTIVLTCSKEEHCVIREEKVV